MNNIESNDNNNTKDDKEDKFKSKSEYNKIRNKYLEVEKNLKDAYQISELLLVYYKKELLIL